MHWERLFHRPDLWCVRFVRFSRLSILVAVCWAPTAFTSATRETRPKDSGGPPAATATATLGRVEVGGVGISIRAVIITWGGRCPLSIGAAAEEEEARITVAWWTTTLQMRPPGEAAAGTTHVEGGADRAVRVPHQNFGLDSLVAENIVLWVVSALHNSVFTLFLGRRGSGMP